MASQLQEFFSDEVTAGRLPKNLLPLQVRSRAPYPHRRADAFAFLPVWYRKRQFLDLGVESRSFLTCYLPSRSPTQSSVVSLRVPSRGSRSGPRFSRSALPFSAPVARNDAARFPRTRSSNSSTLASSTLRPPPRFASLPKDSSTSTRVSSLLRLPVPHRLTHRNRLGQLQGPPSSPLAAGRQLARDHSSFGCAFLLSSLGISLTSGTAGVIAMNTPLEVDMYAHANSTCALGSRMLNGIGGSGDFLRNAKVGP